MSNKFEEIGGQKNYEDKRETPGIEAEADILEPGAQAETDFDKQVAVTAGTKEAELEKARGGIKEIGSEEKAENDAREKELMNLALAKLKEMEQMVVNRTEEKRKFLIKIFVGKEDFEKNKNMALLLIRRQVRALEGRKQKGENMNLDLVTVLDSIKKHGFDLVGQEKIDVSSLPEKIKKNYSAGAGVHTRVLGG